MTKKIIFRLCMTVSLLICFRAHGQTPTYPESSVDQSYIPSSPNSQSFQSFGNEPVALFEGAPAINIPIYTVKCGSLTLPISLSYNYNGFYPLQDAGWVGLGWNLNAGGVVTRIVEGQVDNLENNGYNYYEYTLADSLIHSNNLDSFLQRGYNPDLAYGRNAYDFAPDIFDAEFNGYSNKFFYYKNKAYLLSYTKALQISIPTPTGAITITTDDGTQYSFSQNNQETTTSKYYGGHDSTTQSYISAWFLSQVVSADTKDTIELLYGSNTWSQAQISYQTSYTLSTGSQGDMGYDPLSFPIAPSIQTQTLKTILCRNSRISFISDSASRTDVLGAYPRLKEIDVIDSLTGSIVKKNTFNYEYFGQVSGTPVAAYERLALKNFNSVNPQLSSDTLSYTFKYIHETGAFPPKGTFGVDYWGYYNGHSTNVTIMPPPNSTFYSPSPPGGAGFGSGTVRDPGGDSMKIGALDTLIYPSGGYTAFAYEPNVYNSGTYGAGPGMRLQSNITVSNNSTSPPVQKTYAYLLDGDTTSSGVVTNVPNYTGPPFVINNIGTMNNYNTYRTPNNSSGIGGINPIFYYKKVSETIASGSETHRTDHYFTSFGAIYLDVRETQRVEYSNSNYPYIFVPVTRTVTNYLQFSPDITTSFTYVNPYIDTEYTNNAHSPKIWYSYSYNENFWGPNGVRPGSQIVTQYDKLGDSISTTTSYSYDSTTFNLSSVTTQNLSDGQTIIQRFKYPENYSSGLTGNMVAARVLSPVIERQTWLYKNSSDSVLIAGNITSYDQTSFKPVNIYAIETTRPITSLNNETTSGGKFTSILSDSRYVLKGLMTYDGNNNPSVANKASDINVSYIWDYRHSNPIAEVKNAAQADIAYTSFESDGKGNWTFTGASNADSTSPTGLNCYNLGQTSGNITKSGLTSTNNYIISYWLKRSTPLTITGTASGYPLQGKTINGWTYFEHKITGQTSVTVSGTGTLYIDELRLYPYSAQMTSYTYYPLIGMSSQCDADNRISYYQYDPFGRLKVVKDQDHNIIKTVQYHYIGETNE